MQKKNVMDEKGERLVNLGCFFGRGHWFLKLVDNVKAGESKRPECRK